MVQDKLKVAQKNTTVLRAQERVSERASEQVSATKQASSANQANKFAVQVNELADKRVAHYEHPDFKWA